MATISVTRNTTCSPTLWSAQVHVLADRKVSVLPSSNRSVAVRFSESIAMTLPVICVVSAARPPGWSPFGARATTAAVPSPEVASSLSRDATIFSRHGGVDLVAHADLVKIDGLRPHLHVNFFPSGPRSVALRLA